MRLLYIAHRIPYPPNKGDKIRSYNEVLFLSKRFEVDLVCFLEGPGDDKHLKALQAICRTATGFRRGPLRKAWRLFTGFLAGRPLSVALYDHGGFRAKVRRLIREHEYARIVVFSSQMAQYIPGDQLPRTVLDYCDVDSHKWENYADRMPFYVAWFYRLEARRLFAFEDAASQIGTQGLAGALRASGNNLSFYSQNPGGDPLVSTSGNTVSWGAHIPVAAADGVVAILFGAGTGTGTYGVPEMVGSDQTAPGDFDYWVTRMQTYLASPTQLP